MKTSLKTNIIVDLAMFLSMVVVSVSGIVIKIIAPLRRLAYESWVRDVAYWIVGDSRRLWSRIHLWSGVVMLLLLVLHIVLHWQTIDGFVRKHIKSRAWRGALYVVLFLLLLLSVIPWVWAF